MCSGLKRIDVHVDDRRISYGILGKSLRQEILFGDE